MGSIKAHCNLQPNQGLFTSSATKYGSTARYQMGLDSQIESEAAQKQQHQAGGISL